MRVGGADWVRTYQEALAKQGYYRGAIDGANGPNTHAALVACLEAGCRLLQLVVFISGFLLSVEIHWWL